MDSIEMWEELNDLKVKIVSKINKIIIFGKNTKEIIFITRDGKVYGFGNNSFGELGFGHKNQVKEPENIIEFNDKQVIDFSCGLTHVLAKTITGKLYSWGDNSVGQLGNGTNRSDYRPKLIHSLSDKCVIAMSCGEHHSLVLTDDHQLYGFGYNHIGQIGCGNTDNQLKPIKIKGFNNKNVISISCGALHSLALTQRGDVYSWGWNAWGQLGIGNKNQTYKPKKIVVSNGLLFKQIVCGNTHSLLLSECGDVYAFGYNGYGSLGTGDTIESLVPIKVIEIKNVIEIATHFHSSISMAKLKDNETFVWGQCLTENYVKPFKTKFQSFNNVMAYYSMNKSTVKPIDIWETNTDKWYKIDKSFNIKRFSDLVFEVGNKDIFVNKLILKLNSDYFRNKYSSTESLHGIENIEVIDNYSYEVFYSYLKYIYTQTVEIENQYLCQLLRLSMDYNEKDLIIKCSERIFSSNNNWITFENIVQLMKHSIERNMNELKVKCIDRIENMKTIQNICNVYGLCVEYGLNELKKNCIEFFQSLGNNEKQLILDTDSYNALSVEIKVQVLEKLFKRKEKEIE